MTQKGFIIDIVPITRLPLSKQQFFSYLWETELVPGTLVDIPLFRRNTQGVVVRSRSDFHRLGNIQLKKINKVLEENFLTSEQLKLAQFISDYYFSPLGTVVKFMVPKRTKQRKKSGNKKTALRPKNIELTEEQKEAVARIVSPKPAARKFFLFGPASSGKTEVYIDAIAKLKSKKEKFQALILLPELTLTPQAVERYGQHFDIGEIALLHSKLSKGQYYSNWQKIRSGEAKIVIGTRMAVLAPFRDLKLIIIDEEQDISFKQWDMNPKYDARRVATELVAIHNARIVMGSATPGIESFYHAQKKDYELLELPKLKIPGIEDSLSAAEIETVDMRKERWNKNYSVISRRLKSELAFVLKHKRQAVLFVNRQGMSAFSICAKCKKVLACPKCERALIYENSGNYKCLHCSYQSGALVNCPGCRGMEFKNIGVGTQKVEREVKSLFPGASVLRVDSPSMQKQGAAEDAFRQFSDGEYDILIGTQMITKGWDLPNVSLIGIIDADSLLAIPDFKTDEKAFQNILQVAGRTNRVGSLSPGTVLIQTYQPENFVLRTASRKLYRDFYAKEIEDRRILGFPPFKDLLKLTIQDYDSRFVEKEAERVVEELSRIKSSDFIFSPPLKPLAGKIRGRFRMDIILRITPEKYPAALKQLLVNLGKGWMIDRDPISLS